MLSMKKVWAVSLLLSMLFPGNVGVLPRASLGGTQVIEREVKLLPHCLKMLGAGLGIVDSTGNYEYTVHEDGTAEILKYLKEDEKIMIPPQLDGNPVTAIGEEAFDYKLSAASIQLPGTVTDIKSRAFSRTGIKEIIIPESVIKIGEEAFWYCRKLEKLYIPQNVKKIEGNIVQWSGKLTEIDVDSRNASYASVDGILYNKAMTELLAVPGGRNMTGFQIPDSVACIGEDAFSQCANESFTEIIIPDRVAVLGVGAFADCRNLKKTVIGKGVEDIVQYAFFQCDSLCEVIINGKLKSIGKQAFLGCRNLAKISIPDGIVEIGEDAFQDCHSLKNITLPKSIAKIGEGAFGFHEEGLYPDVSITGYVDTAACDYAKKYHIVFRDIETGEDIRYDLLPVPEGKIKKLVAGKKKIRLVYKEVEEASYQIAVKKVGAASWKKYGRLKPSAVIKNLKSGKPYRVKVRAVCEIDGKRYFGEWSRVKKVTVR